MIYVMLGSFVMDPRTSALQKNNLIYQLVQIYDL